jgi:hypothetical protein
LGEANHQASVTYESLKIRNSSWDVLPSGARIVQ